MTKRIIISLAQENQAVEENEITGAAIDQTKEQEQSSQAGAVVVPLEDSEEEIAAILAVEELSEEIANDQAEVDRSIEVADGLEDVATIAENIDQPSPTDIALIQTAANMAVAGTDGDATELVPAAESITSGKALAADLRERISYANEGIKDSFKKIGEKLATLGERISEKLSSFIGRVAAVRQALNASEKTKFTVKIKEGDFSVAGGVKIATAADLTKAVNQTMAFQADLCNQSLALNKNYTNFASNIIDNIKANMFFTDTKSKQGAKWFGPIMTATNQLANTKGSIKNTIASKDGNTIVIGPAIGDYVVKVSSPDKAAATADGMSIKDFLDVFKKYDIQFEKNGNAQSSEAAEFEVNKQYIEGLIASIEKLANTSITFVKSNRTLGQKLAVIFSGGLASPIGSFGSESRLFATASQAVTGRAMNINNRLMSGVEKMSDNVARGLLRVAIRAVNAKEEVAQESFNV